MLLNIRQRWLLVIPVFGIMLMLLPIELREQFYLHIELVKQGEYWRVFTGHFIYVSWLHWALNTLGLLLLILIANNDTNVSSWWIPIIFILAAVSTGLLLTSKNLVWYAGFSGILTGLFAFFAIHSITQNRVFSIAILVALSIYVYLQLSEGELVVGSLSTLSSSYAHLFGLIAGVIYGVIIKAIQSTQKQRLNRLDNN